VSIKRESGGNESVGVVAAAAKMARRLRFKTHT